MSRITFLLALLVAASFMRAEDVTLKAVPPVVVKAVPEAGAEGIDPATKEIRVTFSKNMRDGSWSWSTLSPESFPETTGKPHYEADKRTCVLPVRLKPGTTYAIWLNSAKFGNFKDADGNPAVAYLLVFKTK
jgi:RNA polymerase sigma-70 factor (ECF subfamily)